MYESTCMFACMHVSIHAYVMYEGFHDVHFGNQNMTVYCIHYTRPAQAIYKGTEEVSIKAAGKVTGAEFQSTGPTAARMCTIY